MKEDVFYSEYLDKRTNQIVTVPREEKLDAELLAIKNLIPELTNKSQAQSIELVENVSGKVQERFRWKVGVNDGLDNFAEVRDSLKEGIPVSGIFGLLYGNGKPKGKKISFAPVIDLTSKKRILLLVSKLGFDAYDYLSDEGIEYGEITENILIGSYGQINNATVPISPELINLLNSDPEPVDLSYYESKIYTKNRQDT